MLVMTSTLTTMIPFLDMIIVMRISMAHVVLVKSLPTGMADVALELLTGPKLEVSVHEREKTNCFAGNWVG